MNSILLAATSSSAGMGLFKPLYWLFGVCMGFLMDLLNNQYFVAIVIFTVVTRVILLPFNIHQQKTMAKTARLQPKLAKLQKKYGTEVGLFEFDHSASTGIAQVPLARLEANARAEAYVAEQKEATGEAPDAAAVAAAVKPKPVNNKKKKHRHGRAQ